MNFLLLCVFSITNASITLSYSQEPLITLPETQPKSENLECNFTEDFLINGSWPSVTGNYIFYSYALAKFLWNSIPSLFERSPSKRYSAKNIFSFEKLTSLLGQKFENTINQLPFTSEKRSILFEFLNKVMSITEYEYLVIDNQTVARSMMFSLFYRCSKSEHLLVSIEILILLSVSSNLKTRSYHEDLKRCLVNDQILLPILSLGAFSELHQALEEDFEKIIYFVGRNFSDLSSVTGQKIIDYPYVGLVQLHSVLPNASKMKDVIENFFKHRSAL